MERPIAAAPAFTGLAERPDVRTIRSIGRKDGRLAGEATYAISGDGRTLTATVRGIDAEHRQFETMVVWERAGDATA